MKILEKGCARRKAWEGKKTELKCGKCRCVFQIEHGDQVRAFFDDRQGTYFEAGCPGCDTAVTFRAR